MKSKNLTTKYQTKFKKYYQKILATKYKKNHLKPQNSQKVIKI